MPLVVSVLPTDLALSYGGGERCAFEIHSGVRRLLPDWEARAVGASTDPERIPLPEGWTNLVRPGPREPHAQDALDLRRLLRAVPASTDLVIAHQWQTRAMAALRLRPHRGVLAAIDHGGGSTTGSRVARLPLPRVDLAVIQSVFEARVTPLRGRRMCNMRGGIVDGLFRPPAGEDRGVDFLMVGRFVPHKGQREFLEALPVGTRALLIGPSGTYDPAYRETVLRLAEQRGVVVRTDVGDPELVAAYQQARYVVQVPIAPPGSAPELLGLSLLEGMACGAVPICPSEGASVEFAVEGMTGHNYTAGSVADLRRTLTQALGDEPGRRRLAQAGLAEARRWTWSAAARTLLEAAGCTSG